MAKNAYEAHKLHIYAHQHKTLKKKLRTQNSESGAISIQESLQSDIDTKQETMTSAGEMAEGSVGRGRESLQREETKNRRFVRENIFQLGTANERDNEFPKNTFKQTNMGY